LNVAVGDSLYHGGRFDEKGEVRYRQRGLIGDEGQAPFDLYELEDVRAVNSILGQQYHAVVGNPPYIEVKDKAVSTLYRSMYDTCYKKYHLSSPFTERFLDLTLAARNGQRPGYTGLIIDNAFMKRSFGKALVEYLRGVDLTHIVGVENVPIPGNGTPSVILVGRNRKSVAPTVRTVLGIKGEFPPPEIPAEGKVWCSILQLIDTTGESEWVSVVDMPREQLREHPWSMGGGGAAELKAVLDSTSDSTLVDYADELGILGMTNADEVMLAPLPAFRRRGVESQCYRRIVTGDDVREWSVEEGLGCVFPYADGRLLQLASVPGLQQWLWPTRTTLGCRATFSKQTYFEEGRPWWEWHQLTLHRLYSPLSIIWGEVTTHNHFALDRGGKIFNRTAPVLKLKATEEAAHFEILGLLNSSTAGFWMRQVCFPKGGDQVKQGRARVRRTWWEERFAFASTPLGEFPIPREKPGTLAQRIDSLAQEYGTLLPARLVRRTLPTRSALDAARDKAESLRRQMIALQEELDWQVYHLYGLTPEPLTLWRQTSRSADASRTDLEVCPHISINLGERAFEIVMARKLARKELETAWFERHGSTPITDLPAHWPEDYRRLIEQRIRLIETDKNIGLIEQPEFKRRWSLEKPKKTFRQAWVEMEQDALRGWLLDRLESERYWPRPQPGQHSPAELKSCRELAGLAALDAEFQQVGELYTGFKDFDVQELVTALVLAESVPFLPVLRYTDSGLRKRTVWERVWEKQRAEDPVGTDLLVCPGLAGQTGRSAPTEVPPKYKKEDFQKDALGKEGLWRLRGELDVPKERWVSYPPLAERQGDEEPSPVVTWAGYNHLDQALALAKYFDERKERDVGSREWMLPLIAGLEQLLPWLLQWHNEPNPAYEGQKMGDYFRDVVLPDALQSQGLTLEQCRAWRPPAAARRPRQRKVRGG
jgi:hypothetical protein